MSAAPIFLAGLAFAVTGLGVIYPGADILYAAWCIPPAFACLLAGLYRLGD